MKSIKKFLRYLAIAMIIVGLIVISIAYISNQSFLAYLIKIIESSKASVGIKQVLFGLALIFIALIILIISFKIKDKEDKNNNN